MQRRKAEQGEGDGEGDEGDDGDNDHDRMLNGKPERLVDSEQCSYLLLILWMSKA